MVKTIFFGSTQDSVIILNKLNSSPLVNLIKLCAIVTQSPKPVGRKEIITKTPVHIWGENHHIPTHFFSTSKDKNWIFQNPDEVIGRISSYQPDLIISASFGVKIPISKIQLKYDGINIHPSILPRWRGGDPVPWAILADDKEIGVSITTISDQFDKGKILSQQIIPLPQNSRPDPLRNKLFDMGGDLLIKILPQYVINPRTALSQNIIDSHRKSSTFFPYAVRFSRDHGFVLWKIIQGAINGHKWSLYPKPDMPIMIDYIKQHLSINQNEPIAVFLERMIRALYPWPGVWTKYDIKKNKSEIQTTQKRMKILKAHLIPASNYLKLDTIQFEGKKPVSHVSLAS